MTHEEIRVMDGPTLTHVAYAMQLAPPGYIVYTDPGVFRFRPNKERDMLWYPHKNLTQAHALLRSVLARGWDTRLIYKGLTGYGSVSVGLEQCIFSTDTEATAILRCVLLAGLSEGIPIKHEEKSS